jgi:hypothetical protein
LRRCFDRLTLVARAVAIVEAGGVRGIPRGVMNLRRNPELSPRHVLDPVSTRELNCAPHDAGFEAVPSALDTDLPHSSGRTSCRQSMGVPESRIAASLMAPGWRLDLWRRIGADLTRPVHKYSQ